MEINFSWNNKDILDDNLEPFFTQSLYEEDDNLSQLIKNCKKSKIQEKKPDLILWRSFNGRPSQTDQANQRGVSSTSKVSLLFTFLSMSLLFVVFILSLKSIRRPSQIFRRRKSQIPSLKDKFPPRANQENARKSNKKMKQKAPFLCRISPADYFLGLKDGETNPPSWKKTFLKKFHKLGKVNEKGVLYMDFWKIVSLVKKTEASLFWKPHKKEFTLTYQEKRMHKAIFVSEDEWWDCQRYWGRKANGSTEEQVSFFRRRFNDSNRKRWEAGLPALFKDWDRSKDSNPLVILLLLMLAYHLYKKIEDEGKEVADGIPEEIKQKILYVEPFLDKALKIEN